MVTTNSIKAAILGYSEVSVHAKELVDNVYNTYLKEYASYSEPIEVVAYVDAVSIGEKINDIPIISIRTFVEKYKAGELEILILPLHLLVGQTMLITELMKLGISLEDIICISREKFSQTSFSAADIENLLDPYLNTSYLPYLEYHVADHCNLNCKACEHYAPLVKTPIFTDYEQFKKDLFQLKTFISDIGMIRIMGGEPLLNNELKKFILLTRHLYPDSVIQVVTNALLLEKMDDELFYLMKQLKVMFWISYYPPMEKKMEWIHSFLDSKGVEHGISPKMDYFTMKQNLNGNSDAANVFYSCFQAHCNNIYRGKIAACFLPFTTKYFNEQFGYNLPMDGAVDLYDPTLTTEKLKLALFTPFERCKYCNSYSTKIDWTQASKEPTLSDWISGYSL